MQTAREQQLQRPLAPCVTSGSPSASGRPLRARGPRLQTPARPHTRTCLPVVAGAAQP